MDRGGGGGGGGGGGAGAAAGGAGGAGAPKASLPLNYICGHCNSLNRLSPRDIVRCKECGYRIFYKVRPDRRAWWGGPPLAGRTLRGRICAPRGAPLLTLSLSHPPPAPSRGRPLHTPLPHPRSCGCARSDSV
jgi:DNA-directed RNA polymerase I, II, and III subunit RPABC4